MRFYPQRSAYEQSRRLPQSQREHYLNTQIDRIYIDGVELYGYFEYSFLEEKSFVTQPVRANDGSIENIDDIATILTPRVIIRYNMMHIDDYRKLMKLLKSKNSFMVTCYDIVEDKQVTHQMYVAPPQMPVIYQQYLMALGIQEYTIELIGTNNTEQSQPDEPTVSLYNITYNLNIPSDVSTNYPSTITQKSDALGNAIVGAYYNNVLIGSSDLYNTTNTMYYVFDGWIDEDGTNLYNNGDVISLNSNISLTANWKSYSTSVEKEYTIVYHLGDLYTQFNSTNHTFYVASTQSGVIVSGVPESSSHTTKNATTIIGIIVPTIEEYNEVGTNKLIEDADGTLYTWTFEGWNCNGTVYKNGASFNLKNATTHFYAQWTREM